MKKFLYVFLSILVLSMSVYFLIPSPKLSKDYCAFCDPKVIAAQKFYENDAIIALYTHKPVVPGHCLIIPKRHAERFEQLTDQEAASISSVIKKVDQASIKIFNRASYLLMQKNGVEAGQTVPHVHFHYFPREAGDDSPVKFMAQMLVSVLKKPLAPTEMKKICEKMKEAM